MPRIAVLADIHGNVPALDAVIADIESQEIDEVLVGGDLVGRGPEGSKVIARIRERGWRSVRGNHEDYLLDFRRGHVPSDWLDADEWAAPRWMAAELSDDDAAYVDSLPMTLTAEAAPRLRLVHGTPRSHNEGIGPWTGDDELAFHARSIEEPLLVCAHTHRPLERRVADTLVVNVGAVGLPFNRDQRAQYAVFEIDGEAVTTHPRQVEYDLDEIFAIYESTGFREQGGVTAELLRLELVHATPYLVPFLRWAAATNTPPALDRLPEFERFYHPGESLRCFYKRLRERA